MTEAMIIEAVKSAGTARPMADAGMVGAAQSVADPAAVAQFQGVMNASETTPVPLASQIAETWGVAQQNHQGILHRIKALVELRQVNGPSLAQLTELQYEVMNLSFQQEVVTNVAKKASDAVSTLVKNG